MVSATINKYQQNKNKNKLIYLRGNFIPHVYDTSLMYAVLT